MKKDIRKNQTKRTVKMYNHIITWDVWRSRAINDFFWWVDEFFLAQELFKQIPWDRALKILEIPIGTGILTLDHYKNYTKLDITCCDYSPMMLNQAKERASLLGLNQISFLEADVESLPFNNEVFDVILCMNGLHVFRNKEKALWEFARVLKTGGTFLGCNYIEWKNPKTDWLVQNIYLKKGFFALPSYTEIQLKKFLECYFSKVELKSYKAQWLFMCKK